MFLKVNGTAQTSKLPQFLIGKGKGKASKQ